VFRSYGDSSNFSVSLADDYVLEYERTNNQNFKSTNEDIEDKEIDYPLFAPANLGHDGESFCLKSMQKYYTGFLLELCPQDSFSQNIITLLLVKCLSHQIFFN
jgi:hypothetical protein